MLIVQLQYEITQAEYLEMALLRHRSSIRWTVGIFGGVAGLVFGLALYRTADPILALILIGFSVLLLLVQFVAPSLVFRHFYRRNSRMFGPRTVTITETGIVADTQLGHTETTWSNFEKFQETRRLFLMYQSTDVIGILPKRVFDSAGDLEKIRVLISGKLRRV